MIKTFLDANVFFAGFMSEKGASHFLLELASRGKVGIWTSRLVLRESEKNLRVKAPALSLKKFHRYLGKVHVHVVPVPSEKVQKNYEEWIHPKDVPVLAAAVVSEAEYLLTFDRRHFMTETLLKKIHRPKIMTPGDFLQNIYR